MKQQGFANTTLVAVAAALLVTVMVESPAAWAQRNKPQTAPPKVYRWVDENGEVHYSETLPPDWQGETHDELGQDGIVREEDVSRKPPPPAPKPEPKANQDKSELPRDKSGLKRPEPRYTDAQKQDQMDRMLMLRYKSEKELQDAMEVEVNQLKYDKQLLTATHNSLETSLRSNIDLAGHRQRAGLEVKDETLKDIARIRARLAENQRSMEGLNRREESIRASFERELERYRELVKLYSEEGSG